MSSKTLLTILGNSPKRVESGTNTLDFLSIKIGAAAMEIKQLGSGGSASFDFSGRKLSNLTDGVSGNDGATVSQVAAKISSTEKGAALGVATLDASSKIPVDQLPNSVMEYKGAWNAATNTPSLVSGTGNNGDVYRVSVSGAQDLGEGSETFFVGDFAIYNGTVWQRSPAANGVSSVNGMQGAVTLDSDDIDEGSTNLYYTSDRFNSSFSGKSTDDLSEGSTNKYYSAIQARTDLITQSITDGVSGYAPSADAVYDALAGKSNTGHAHVAADVSDFSSAAKTAAVVNSTAGSETDQAPSVSATKSYVSSVFLGVGSLQMTNKHTSTITIRQFVYWSAAGQVKLAQATDPDVAGFDIGTIFGCVYDASIAADAAGTVYLPEKGALVSGFSGLTVNEPVYLSRSTLGGYQQDLTGFLEGEHVVLLGKAVSATQIVFLGRYLYQY